MIQIEEGTRYGDGRCAAFIPGGASRDEAIESRYEIGNQFRPKRFADDARCFRSHQVVFSAQSFRDLLLALRRV